MKSLLLSLLLVFLVQSFGFSYARDTRDAAAQLNQYKKDYTNLTILAERVSKHVADTYKKKDAKITKQDLLDLLDIIASLRKKVAKLNSEVILLKLTKGYDEKERIVLRKSIDSLDRVVLSLQKLVEYTQLLKKHKKAISNDYLVKKLKRRHNDYFNAKTLKIKDMILEIDRMQKSKKALAILQAKTVFSAAAAEIFADEHNI